MHGDRFAGRYPQRALGRSTEAAEEASLIPYLLPNDAAHRASGVIEDLEGNGPLAGARLEPDATRDLLRAHGERPEEEPALTEL